MRAVNLLPRDAQPKQSFRGSGAAIVGGVAVAAVVAVALGAGFMSAHSRALSEQGKLADAQLALQHASVTEASASADAAKRTKPAKPIVAVPAVTAEQLPRLTALAQALAGRVAWDRVLREFSLVVPSDVTVSSLTMSSPDGVGPAASLAGSGSATTPAGGDTKAPGFSLTGLAFSNDSVARLLSRLMLVPDLTSVSLTNSSADPVSGQVSFTINAELKGAPDAGASS